MTNLDLGCGDIEVDGYIGVDKIDFEHNIVIDIEKEGLKRWEAKSIDKLRAFAFLEHIEQKNVIRIMNECWRVLKPRHHFEILVPRADSPSYSIFSDPTHLSYCWMPSIFEDYFTGKNEEAKWYGIKPWKIDTIDKYKKTLHVILEK